MAAQNSTKPAGWLNPPGRSYVAALAALVCWISIASATYAGTWTPLTRTAPSSVGLMILLSDGTVLCQNSGGNAWYRLTPDSQGHYINGTWTTIQAMHDTRLYCSTQLLGDGRLFIAGGEYGTGGKTGETYDPLTNTWTIAPLPGHTFSDSNSGLLPDGRVIVALVETNLRSTLLYSPATNTWATGPTTVGIHNESVWVKLPDDSILFVDRNTTSSERYIPASNQWISDATVPVSLYDPYGLEAGAALLLPNGKAFFISSLGHTAIYTPSGTTANGSWIAGPDLPNSTGQPDAPAAMLPNGKVLCAVSPTPTSSNHFPTPTTFYEYDYTTNSFASVSTPTGGTLSHACFLGTMLVLPDGTALYADFNTRVYSYQPDGSPVASGKPVIGSVTRNADGSLHLSGTGLNGISEGSSYGDDNQNSTNYPIVRLTAGDGTVYFARTYRWSRNGVMTGTSVVTTEFMLPNGLPAGTYALTAIANGISSDPMSISFSPIVISLPTSATEGSAPVSGTVTLPTATTADLVVNLSSSLTSRATTPASVTVLAGQTAASFSLTVVNDVVLNGSQAVAVSASASGYQSGVRNIVIVDDETANLSVTPTTNLSSSGVVGGPFNPMSVAYTLTNTGNVSLNWVASKSAAWDTLSAGSGSIAAGSSVTVTFSIYSTSANTLPASTYTDTLIFNNTTNGSGNTSRSATLVINSPPTMGVTPSTGLTSTGVYGGTFSPSSTTYTLSNPGTVSLNWSASKTASWINLSPTSGTITAGSTASVVVSYNSNAAALVPATYSDTVTLTNTSSGNGNTTRAVSLTVTGSPSMSVTPAGTLAASGNYGGPFTPASTDYTITNTGNAPLNWTAAKTQAWVTLSGSSGTLAPGGTATVTASINTGAATLNPASYSDTVTFTNSNNDAGNTTRVVGLSVTLPAPVMVAEPAITGGTSNTISWNSVSGATLYDAQESASATFSSPVTNSTSSLNSTFNSLNDGVTYYYRVRSNGANGYTGPWSTAVSSQQDSTSPSLTISGQTTTLKSSVQLQGTSSDTSGVVAVQVGGLTAQTTDSFAHWTATITNLANGSNSIAVTASDGATPANVTTSTWSITRLADSDADGLPDAWEDARGLTGADRSALADPDKDGIPNLLEYALNLDPKTTDVSRLPSATTAVKPSDGRSYLTFTYARRIDGGGLLYSVETSPDLSLWNSTSTNLEQVGLPSANPDGITETVTVRVLPAADQVAAKFVRLRVIVQ